MDSQRTKIPIFVQPTTLKFYLGSRESHKQKLIIYNPYDFRIKFDVLCTTPKKYMVNDPTGSIGPCSYVEVFVRHIMPMLSNCNIIDRFRVHMEDHTTKAFLGTRDIEASMLDEEPDSNSSNDCVKFDTMPQSTESHNEDTRNVQYSMNMSNQLRDASSQSSMAIAIGIFCCLVLVWPCYQDSPAESTFIPTYMYTTNTVKHVAAYILGLVTIVLLRK